MLKTIINAIAVYVGWFACAIGAAKGMPLIGVLVVLAYLSLHLFFISGDRAGEGKFILVVGAIGLLVDGLMKATGLINYAGDSLNIAFLAPLWIVALWLQFATTLNASLAWLQHHYLIATLLGVIFGPLSYAGGAKLGALSFPRNQPFTLFVLAMVWGTAIPALAGLAKRMCRSRK